MSLFGVRRHAPLPAEGYVPGFDGATGWLHSPPLTAEDLRGKVVLVDFWTYTCINWLRTLAYVRAWAEKYQVALRPHLVERSLDQARAELERVERKRAGEAHQRL